VAEAADLQGVLAGSRPGLTLAIDGDDGRYRIEGAAPDAALIAALAGWCATADRLIVELRTAGGSLEDVYLDLVAAGRDDRAAGVPPPAGGSSKPAETPSR
jgi:hypothetical protein